VGQDDNVLDMLGQGQRNKKAAKKFFRQLLKGLTYVPRVVLTDKLRSYGAAKREMLPGGEHRQSRYLNNRWENSHRPTRQREHPVGSSRPQACICYESQDMIVQIVTDEKALLSERIQKRSDLMDSPLFLISSDPGLPVPFTTTSS
jgi:transposase-like protein